MSSGVSEMIGRGVYNTLRKAAKIPLDINHHLLRDEAPLVQRGSVYNHVEGEIGEEEFTELCQDDALVLETIFYCQEELSTLGKSLQASRKLLNSNFDENEQKKRLINHDFLVLKLQPGKQNEPVFYIKAEKVAGGDNGKGKAGIHISVHEGLDDQDQERRCCLHRIECGSIHVGFVDLIAILKKKDPNYDARDENCWDYARKTTKWLLEACKKALEIEGCEKYWRLHWELEHLETNLIKNHAVNTVERVAKYAITHVWDKLKS